MRLSCIRYPGSKSRISDIIFGKLAKFSNNDYIIGYAEPFFGGGTVGIQFLSMFSDCGLEDVKITDVCINDIDIGISALWTSIIRYPELLKQHIRAFSPSIVAFDSFKESLLSQKCYYDNEHSIVSLGFRKLAIHQLSYSGLGTKSGGPLGGRKQSSGYEIGCRWYADSTCNRVDRLHNLFKNFNISNKECSRVDFSSIVDNLSDKWVLYCDPPYYVKGQELYQYYFTDNDHIRLSECLKKTHSKWLLSYDDCTEIRDLYSWAKVEELKVQYSVAGITEKKELLICAKK